MGGSPARENPVLRLKALGKILGGDLASSSTSLQSFVTPPVPPMADMFILDATR